jgi:hypothetical protein
LKKRLTDLPSWDFSSGVHPVSGATHLFTWLVELATSSIRHLLFSPSNGTSLKLAIFTAGTAMIGAAGSHCNSIKPSVFSMTFMIFAAFTV